MWVSFYKLLYSKECSGSDAIQIPKVKRPCTFCSCLLGTQDYCENKPLSEESHRGLTTNTNYQSMSKVISDKHLPLSHKMTNMIPGPQGVTGKRDTWPSPAQIVDSELWAYNMASNHIYLLPFTISLPCTHTISWNILLESWEEREREGRLCMHESQAAQPCS